MEAITPSKSPPEIDKKNSKTRENGNYLAET